MQASQKRQQIIEAATRRLAHFGMQKTNMADIAQDLGISKASLYYYFPDKSSLYAAVFQMIVEEEANTIETALLEMDHTEESIMEILKRRNNFVKKYHNLLSGIAGENHLLNPSIHPFINELQQRQVQLVERSFKKGIISGEIDPNIDLVETSRLFLVALEGIRFLIHNEHEHPVFPTEEEFDTIYVLQQKMCRIFLRGLTPHTP